MKKIQSPATLLSNTIDYIIACIVVVWFDLIPLYLYTVNVSAGTSILCLLNHFKNSMIAHK